MKSLTLHEPYASAIAFGIKQYETRPKKSKHRGLLAIHAGKTFNQSGMDTLGNIPWSDHIKLPLSRRYSGISDADFSKGVIVAVVELVDCLLMDQDLIDSMSDQERSLGDWRVGRYAYKLENVQKLNTPIEARGKQSFWTLPDDILKKLGELDEITLPEPE